MRSLLTPELEIDPAGVAELANAQYLRTRAYWRGQTSTPKPDDATLLRQAGSWARATAEAAQGLALERARRAALTEAERRAEDLTAYRARVANPLTCPDSLFRARIDAQLAELNRSAA